MWPFGLSASEICNLCQKGPFSFPACCARKVKFGETESQDVMAETWGFHPKTCACLIYYLEAFEMKFSVYLIDVSNSYVDWIQWIHFCLKVAIWSHFPADQFLANDGTCLGQVLVMDATCPFRSSISMSCFPIRDQTNELLLLPQ